MDRRESVAYAMRSVEMEGFVFSERSKKQFEMLAEGKISHEEHRAMILRDVEARKRGDRLEEEA
ncbi:antitoxin VbhA family protein [Selenomonas noxia]|jgi:hypothetical protein|uniref:antitoxin VbhA family protein n=1 Tax=Selenomonas noxia TaxID=135083 RepID=UPI00288C2E31|nr:antitoxin VbhA family protein [Selenomonas noxia]